MNDCIFCKIARKEIKAEILEESQNFIAFLDAHPKAKGHTLIIPKKHFTNLMDLPSDLASEMMDMIKKVAEKRIKEGAEGFNIVSNNFPAAGQVVMHTHIHLLPRKSGDGLHMLV
jgi:histidine triad (HIT) family protein